MDPAVTAPTADTIVEVRPTLGTFAALIRSAGFAEIDPVLAPGGVGVSADALERIEPILVEVDVPAEVVVGVSADYLERIEPPPVDGVIFRQNEKVGEVRDREESDSDRWRFRSPRRPPSPFLALLPILLPPATVDPNEPFEFPHPLYKFQGDGIRWLLDHNGALLADDMGLGKTVQAIVALRHKFRTGEALRALVVSPKSVQSSWRRHFEEWAPELQTIVLDGDRGERAAKWRALHEYSAHVGMITYASLRNDIELAKGAPYDILVLDEVQNVKNPATQQSQAVRRLDCSTRWGLSGTPLENSVEELATVIRTLEPGAVPRRDAPSHEVREAARRMMIRRRKEDVLEDLPSINSAIEYVELTPQQRYAYDQAEQIGVAELRKGERVTLTNVLALITRLKQTCNGVTDNRDRFHSSKLEWLTNYLDIVEDEGDKALVFSQYVKTLGDIELTLRGFDLLTYTGQMSTRERDDRVARFQNDSAHTVMLMSLKAGGTGITLTAANRVVHFDSWWNPAVMKQATARVHRIGQRKPVFETTLVAENTIEERIQRILDRKEDLFDKVVDDLSVEGISRALTEEELYGLFDLKPPRR